MSHLSLHIERWSYLWYTYLNVIGCWVNTCIIITYKAFFLFVVLSRFGRHPVFILQVHDLVSITIPANVAVLANIHSKSLLSVN
jgi:hypothetical protein